MKIYLIGFMGSGKTRLGKELAGLLDMPCIDLDELFEERYRVTILDFFAKYGEQAFRLIEHKLLLETEELQDCLVSTGGGTPCFFNNMEFMNEHGLTIYINMSDEALETRLRTIRKKRPLLKDVPNGELLPFIRRQLSERERWYHKAKIKVDGPVMHPATLLPLIKKYGV
jgi:shikimate kinase